MPIGNATAQSDESNSPPSMVRPDGTGEPTQQDLDRAFPPQQQPQAPQQRPAQPQPQRQPNQDPLAPAPDATEPRPQPS
jgi:penicillin-binding protein 1A